jgi:hypothetical protein
VNKKVSVVNSVFVSAHIPFLVLAGLVLRDFLLRDFALTELENYNIFFELTRFCFILTLLGVGDPWPHLSSAEG